MNVIIEKGQEKLVESYSAFVDPWGLFPTKLEESLLNAGITDVFVVGLGMTKTILCIGDYVDHLAEDYCVKCSSLDAKKRGFRTVIVEDCTRGVTPETTETARKELKDQGVEFMHSSAVKKLFE